MATKSPKAAKKSAPRPPTLKQLVARAQKIQDEVNDLLALLRRLDRQKLVITTPVSGRPKNITGP